MLVTQLCPTLRDPVDCSPPGSAECWSELPFPPPGDLPDPGAGPTFPPPGDLLDPGTGPTFPPPGDLPDPGAGPTFPPPGDLPDPGAGPTSRALAGSLSAI